MYRLIMISTCRDMFAVQAIAVFCCMVSVNHSAPVACEDLVQPLARLDHHLEGRWTLVAGSLSDPAHLEFFKRRDSSSIYFSNSSASYNILYTPSIRVGEKCHIQSYSVSLNDSVLTFDVRDKVNLTVTFLYTSCQDCVVMRFDNESNTLLRLYLFSRRRELKEKEMQEFRAQLGCLNMLPPVVMDPTKELCPDQSSINSASAQTKEKQH